MKKTFTYKDCYIILNQNHGCSWNELRTSYKKQIQKWHPDRFKGNTSEKAAAEVRIKSINIAYNQIHKYYKKHQYLPQIETVQQTKPVTDKPKTTSQPLKPTKTTKQRPVKPSISKNTDRSTTNPSTRRSGLSFLSLFIVVFSVYLYFDDEEVNTLPTRDDVNQPAEYPAEYIQSPQITTRSVKQINTDNRIKQSEQLIPEKNLEDNKKLKELEKEDRYFTYGSSVTDVISAQGTPSETEGDIWFYGKSEVHFSDGVVTHWVRDASSPLKVQLGIDIESYMNSPSGR